MKKKVSQPICSEKTAVAYARYSSAGQRDVSIQQQLDDIRSFAAREGYTIIHEYADHAKSGFKRTDSRSEFQAMLTAAEKGTFDTVIAWKVDRFGRNREESAIFKGRLRQRGVRVVYAMEPIPDGAAGVLLEGMLEATAEWYSRNLSENVSRGMMDNARKGMWNGAMLYGYRRGPGGSFEIVEEQAAVVRKIYELYIEGYSSTDVARKISDMGYRTVRGNAFSSDYVLNVISNERYTGLYKWGPIEIPDHIPALVTKDQFRKANEMKRKAARHVKCDVEYILTGKAFCGCCGGLLIGDSGTSKTGVTHHYYSCQNKKNKHTCHLRSCRKAELENTVIDYIMDHCLTGPVKEKIADHVIAAQNEQLRTSPLAGMEKQLRETEQKIDRINDAIADGFASASTAVKLRSLEEIANDLRVTVESLRYSQSQLTTRDRVLFFLEKLSQLDRTDPERRKQLINTFVNSITLYEDGSLRLVINTIEGTKLKSIEMLETGSEKSSSITDTGVLACSHSNSDPEIMIFMIPA